jgi:hypothetical protein
MFSTWKRGALIAFFATMPSMAKLIQPLDRVVVIRLGPGVLMATPIPESLRAVRADRLETNFPAHGA